MDSHISNILSDVLHRLPKFLKHSITEVFRQNFASR